MKKTLSRSSEISREPVVLIFDKKGDLGNALALFLGSGLKKVLVSGKDLFSNNSSGDLMYVPIKKGKIPLIPDFAYSCLVIVDAEGDIDKEYLHEFVKKAEKEKARLVFVSSLKNKPFDYKIVDSYKEAYAVVVGEIFGKEIWDVSTLTGSILYQASVSSSIKIPKMGMDKIHPVFLEDVLVGISKVLFSNDLSSRVYFLFPKHPITTLSFSRLIKKISPLVKLDFVKAKTDEENREGEYEIPKTGEYLLSERYRLEEKIRESSLLSEAEEKDSGYLENKGAVLRLDEPRKKGKRLYGILVFLLSVILTPFLASFLLFLVGGYAGFSAQQAVGKGDMQKAFLNADFSYKVFLLTEDSARIANLELSLVGYSKGLSDFNRLTVFGKGASFVFKTLADSYIKTQAILEGKDPNYQKDFFIVDNGIKQAMLVLEELKTEPLQPKGLLAGVFKMDKALLVLKSLNNYSMIFDLAGSLSDNAPQIFGVNNKKTYLVLFQNNMELRPGGGFIGSYGILSFDKGRIGNFSTSDVYDADGQLKGHVEPPYPIRRYLLNPNWYLRDSNFDVDFTRDASSSAFFLNQETGQVVDGVIAVDVSFVKNLLRAIGPVYVPDYNENVTSNNVYLLTEEHAEKNFFPGSTQKKDFLRSLLTAMEVKFKSGNIDYARLFKAINNSIEEKHLLFAFSNPSLQGIFTANGVSSSLWDNRQNDSSSFNDFLGVNEANLGANKANYFLKRSIKKTVSIDNKGGVTSTVSVKYQNSGSKWPGGDYKTYIRFIVPFGSMVSDITIDGQKQKIVPAVTDPSIYEAKNFVPPHGLEVETYNEEGKTIIGFLIIVPSEKSKTVTISYESSQNLAMESGFFTYDLKVFKQPGTESDPFSLTINYPSGFRVYHSNYKLNTHKNSTNIFTGLNTDKEYDIEFSKK